MKGAAIRPVRALALAAVAVLFGATLLLAAAGCGGSTSDTMSTAVAKLDRLTLVAPPGPMAIPMAYLVVNDKLADVAEETELLVWENADQLRALVADGQGDLITGDTGASSFSDIEGQSLVVSFQGSVPDVMFQYLATKEGLDPATAFALRYATDPTQAAQLLVAGQVENAVLSEALATSVILQTKDKEVPLRRALAFDEAWAAATGAAGDVEALQTPIAGVVATATVMAKPEVIAAFEREYAAALQWMLNDPAGAGQLVETELPELGLKAAVLTASLQNITWRHTPAAEARTSLESFYTALMELSPEVIGGKLPDDG
jgi:NitT/TauT family transport system substrate-binding protein